MPHKIGHLHEKICTSLNIEAADDVARIGKRNKARKIKRHDKNRVEENETLRLNLLNLTFKSSPLHDFMVVDRKRRTISSQPYYPDGIAHHAILNYCTPIWDSIIIPTSYSCIVGRGIHKMIHDIEDYIRSNNLKYCAQLDYYHYFPSMPIDKLKGVIARKIKDKNVQTLLYEIIDNGARGSDTGIPMGSWPSQYFGNLFPSYLFHEVQRLFGVRIFVYMDDMLMFSNDKKLLHAAAKYIVEQSMAQLGLVVKPNYRIYPISTGVDICGYVIYPDHTKIRKSMKKKIWNVVNNYVNGTIDVQTFFSSMMSYYGWIKHADGHHLLRKIEEKTGIKLSGFRGKKVGIKSMHGKNVRLIHIAEHKKYFILECVYKGKPYEIRSKSTKLFRQLKEKKLPTNITL